MAIEKIYARFLRPVSVPEKGKKTVYAEDLILQYVEYGEATTARLKKEAAKYEVCSDNDYTYEYDEDDYPTRGSKRTIFEVEKLVSLSSGCYSTDEVRADILIVRGHFAGVVVYTDRRGGNGWNNYSESGYAILYKDGRIVGNNVSSYSYSGASSSKDDEYTYTLRKKK